MNGDIYNVIVFINEHDARMLLQLFVALQIECF